MSKIETIRRLRETFDDAIGGKIDIHDWTAEVLSVLTETLDRVEVKVAAENIAANGPNGYFHDQNVAKIRGALSRAALAATTEEEKESVTIPLTKTVLKSSELMPEAGGSEGMNQRAEIPAEIQSSLARFREEHGEGEATCFIMMQFGRTTAHEGLLEALKDSLREHGIEALRADEKEYHDDLFYNVLTYLHGCRFGVAVFERIEEEAFNPNVSLEVGYMMALGKPVLLLKDKTLKALQTDLAGRLYKVFDSLNPAESIPTEVARWLGDRRLTGSGRGGGTTTHRILDPL